MSTQEQIDALLQRAKWMQQNGLTTGAEVLLESADNLSRLSEQAQAHKDWLDHIINALRYPADVEQARSIAIQALNDLSK